MAFDDIPEDLQRGYPCDCGGNITQDYPGHVLGGLYDPNGVDVCCDQWSCDECGKVFRQCERNTQGGVKG